MFNFQSFILYDILKSLTFLVNEENIQLFSIERSCKIHAKYIWKFCKSLKLHSTSNFIYMSLLSILSSCTVYLKDIWFFSLISYKLKWWTSLKYSIKRAKKVQELRTVLVLLIICSVFSKYILLLHWITRKLDQIKVRALRFSLEFFFTSF